MIWAEVFAAEWTFKWEADILLAVLTFQDDINFFEAFLYGSKLIIGDLNTWFPLKTIMMPYQR